MRRAIRRNPLVKSDILERAAFFGRRFRSFFGGDRVGFGIPLAGRHGSVERQGHDQQQAANPINPFTNEKVAVIKNPGQPNMEIVVKDGEKLERYKSSGAIGQGEGAKAGVAYRLKDGSMVYVPE